MLRHRMPEYSPGSTVADAAACACAWSESVSGSAASVSASSAAAAVIVENFTVIAAIIDQPLSSYEPQSHRAPRGSTEKILEESSITGRAVLAGRPSTALHFQSR